MHIETTQRPPIGMRSHALKSQECHEFYRKAFIGMQSTNLYFEWIYLID